MDNNKAKQGTELYGKPIRSPQILKEMKKGSYIVLILSKHVMAIREQLQEYGIDEADYYDIYNEFVAYFRIKKFEKDAYDFIDFLERIPDGYFSNIPVKEGKKIGIVCLGEMVQHITWYAMAQSLVLRYNGYQSTLIIDTLKSFDSYIYFEGVEAVAKIYIDYIVNILQEKCPDIGVAYIDEEKCTDLDDEDLAMSHKFAPIVVKWLNSRRDEVFLPREANRILIAENLLNETMRHIKYFLENSAYDTINVYTGIHRHRCVYTYLGKKMGMRVSTYDGDKIGITIYGTTGVSTHRQEIATLINENAFTEQERKDIATLAKEDFNQRRDSVKGNVGYNFQIVKGGEIERPYDVVIPLNIFWDSAALGRNNLFENEIEWLKETLEFLMKNTNATVMVREHPAQYGDREFLYARCDKELPILLQYPERIFFADAAAKVNTYQYIEACKLVLPYTSTTGIESVLMGKNVILHTNVYYDDIDIAYKAHSKQDYFDKIQYYLQHSQSAICQNIENAYMAYYFLRHYDIRTPFTECDQTKWIGLSVKEICEMPGVEEIVGIIAQNEPAVYKNVKRILKARGF
ncbi:MAG: hypothetical protein K2L07_03995 [Lachnospiraceae bacterium]|nr:hypothetical protein [Lachnospiraceae bacterium]